MTTKKSLTPRQIEFLVYAANGLSYEEIAEHCYVAHYTVRKTLYRARKRLGARTREQVILKAIAYELIAIDHEGTASVPVYRASHLLF